MSCQARQDAAGSAPAEGAGCNTVEYDAATEECGVHHLRKDDVDLGGSAQPRTAVWLNPDALVMPGKDGPIFWAVT